MKSFTSPAAEDFSLTAHVPPSTVQRELTLLSSPAQCGESTPGIPHAALSLWLSSPGNTSVEETR